MSRSALMSACDALLEEIGAIRVGAPTATRDVVSIDVAEGGELLCFFQSDRLVYVEYAGGVFLERAKASPRDRAIAVALVVVIVAAICALAWLAERGWLPSWAFILLVLVVFGGLGVVANKSSRPRFRSPQ
jgi:hypothetical protein